MTAGSARNNATAGSARNNATAGSARNNAAAGSAWNSTAAESARRLPAETIGTYFLVGCGAIVVGCNAAAIALFLVVLALIGGLGHISAAHFNPAVSPGFLLTRRLSGRRSFAYAGAQPTGAVLGGDTLSAVWLDRPAALGSTVPSISSGRAVVVEALLMPVIATDTRAVGLADAAVVGATSAAFGPLTDAWLNPAEPILAGPRAAAYEILAREAR